MTPANTTMSPSGAAMQIPPYVRTKPKKLCVVCDRPVPARNHNCCSDSCYRERYM